MGPKGRGPGIGWQGPWGGWTVRQGLRGTVREKKLPGKKQIHNKRKKLTKIGLRYIKRNKVPPQTWWISRKYDPFPQGIWYCSDPWQLHKLWPPWAPGQCPNQTYGAQGFKTTPEELKSIWDQSRVRPSLTNRIEPNLPSAQTAPRAGEDGINVPHAAGLRCAPGWPVTGIGPAREKVQVHDVLRLFTYPGSATRFFRFYFPSKCSFSHSFFSSFFYINFFSRFFLHYIRCIIFWFSS